MRINLSLFIVLFTCNLSSYSQNTYYYGTPEQITNSMIGSNINSIIRNGVELYKIKENFNNNLNYSRREFWSLFNKKSRNETIKNKYINLLDEKDKAFFASNYTGLIQTKLTGNKTNRIALLSNLIGGEIDGGINYFAKKEFNDWCNKVFRYLVQNNSVLNYKALNKAFIHNQEYYDKYIEKRNISEFYFKSNFSPLKKNDISFYIALLSLHNKISLKDIQIIIDFFNDEPKVEKAIKAFKNESYVYKNAINFEKYCTDNPKLVISILGDYLSNISPKARVIIEISKTYNTSTDLALKILNNRYLRYGSIRVNNAIELVWNDRNNKRSPCYGVFRTVGFDKYKRNDLIGNTINRNCFADAIGNVNSPWLDLYDFAQKALLDDFTKKTVRSRVLEEISTNNRNKALEIYNKFIAIVDEETILASFYIFTNYPKLIYPNSNKIINKTETFEFINTFLLIERFSLTKLDVDTILFLALLREEYPNKSIYYIIQNSIKNFEKIKDKINYKQGKDFLKKMNNINLSFYNDRVAFNLLKLFSEN